MRKLTQSEAEARATNTGRVLLKSEYTRYRDSHKFQCLKCLGGWYGRYSDVIQGKIKCPHCPAKTRMTTEESREKVRGVHDDNLVLLSEFTGTMLKHLFRCKVCNHEWVTTYSNVYHKGRGCPNCAHQTYDTVYLYNLYEDIYKVGISKRYRVYKRIAETSSKYNIKDPEIMSIRYTEDAAQIEKVILDNFEEFRHRLQGEGGTEMLKLNRNLAQELASLIDII